MLGLKQLLAGGEGDELHFHAINDCLNSVMAMVTMIALLILQEKASRIDRIVSEHQLFSQGLKELQNWVADTSHMLHTYCAPTADKNVLDSRMIKLEV